MIYFLYYLYMYFVSPEGVLLEPVGYLSTWGLEVSDEILSGFFPNEETHGER